MFRKDATLTVLQIEIDEIFFKKMCNKSRSEFVAEIKHLLFNTGKYLYEQIGEENGLNIVLGDYVYYLRYHFFNL